jgi:hypothetical protein
MSIQKALDDVASNICQALLSGMTTKDFGWGTENFHKMGRQGPSDNARTRRVMPIYKRNEGLKRES